MLLLLWPLSSVGQNNLPDDPTEPFIEFSLEPEQPYVQAMVRYTIRLYRHSHLQRGYFLDQNPPELVTELYRDEQPRVVKHAGREYELIEREYLLFPQRSGDIDIPAPVFSSRDLFVTGKSPTLKVKPRPDAGDWHWLPAQALELTQKLELPQGEVSRGMQLERSITIQAQGLTGAQLPELPPPNIDGFEVQDLGSRVEQKITEGIMVGQRHMRQLLIPRQAGKFTVPGIDLKWWDTKNNQAQLARLPLFNLTVVESLASSVAPETKPEPVAVTEELAEDDDQIATAPGSANLKLLATVLSLLVYGVLIWHYRLLPRLKRQLQLATQKRRFQQACQANDPATAAATLIAWGELRWGNQAPVSALGFQDQFDSPEVTSCLRDLDRANYSNNHEWSGTAAMQQVVPHLKRYKAKQAAQSRHQLPPLYH